MKITKSSVFVPLSQYLLLLSEICDAFI